VVDKKLLVQAFETAGRAVGENAILPEFQCFRIKGSTIFTTDGSCSILTSLPELEVEKLDCIVPARIFLDLLKSLDVKELEIKQENDKLSVTSQGVRGKFITLEQASHLNFPSYSDMVWTPIDSSLIIKLGMCRLVVSKDETTGVLCGVCVKDGNLYGTDKYRVVRCFNGFQKDLNVIIPSKFVEMLQSFKDKVTDVNYDGQKMCFRLKDGTILSTCLLVGDYPDMDKFFPDVTTMQKLEFEADVKDIISRHIVFQKEIRDIDKEVLVVLTDGSCEFRSIEPKLGSLNEDVKLKTKSDASFSFIINPLFLVTMPKAMEEFFFDPKQSLVAFKKDDFEYIVLAKLSK
jgi:DNA polymerase III sliding clamp (beta) subunit (PCNA family)